MQMVGALEEVYLPHEIARAAGVPIERVVASVGGADVFVSHSEAVRLGRTLAGLEADGDADSQALFSSFYGGQHRTSRHGIPVAVVGTIQSGVLAMAMALATLGFTPVDAAAPSESTSSHARVRLVFLATPGPGGGGGGGGVRRSEPPARAERPSRQRDGNPILAAPAARIEPAVAPPLDAEPFPIVVAPISQRAAGIVDRRGVLDAEPEADAQGPGQGRGAGTGSGGGAGPGAGPGIGPGTGGGFGGGVFRPGSGVEAPRLLREVKPDYPESARRRGVEGEVVLELVVRRDGTPSDVRVRRRLGSEFDDLAVQAVRQWRFEPGRWRGAPVDVAVEVVVEFRIR
jgi:TonB family protein